MVNNVTLKVKKYTISEIIDNLLTIIENFLSEKNSIFNINTIKVSSIISEQEILLNNSPQIIEIKSKFDLLKKTLIENDYIWIKDISISIKHNQNNQNFYELKYIIINENNLWDQICFNPNNQAHFLDLHKKLLSKFNNLFEFFKENKLDIKFLDEENRKYLELYQSNIQDLKQIQLQSLNNLNEQVKNWDRNFLESKSRLQAQYEQEKKELEDNFTEKNKELENKEALFNERIKNFDERERTVVRRDLLEKIKVIIEEQKEITLSKKTIEKRLLINIVSIIILIITGLASFGGLGLIFYQEFIIGKIYNYSIFIPVTTFTLFFASTLIFFVRWNYQWFKQHADIEFQNKKYLLDILRANWIIEMFFESKQNNNNIELPKEIYTVLSKNMFELAENKYKAEHPVEDILKSLKNIKSINIGDVKIDNKEK